MGVLGVFIVSDSDYEEYVDDDVSGSGGDDEHDDEEEERLAKTARVYTTGGD